MNKYLVYGHTTVTVTCEVIAENEEEAYKAASEQLGALTAYVGNGGTDKLIGVDGEDESLLADEGIEYDDIELIEDDYHTPISFVMKVASDLGWTAITDLGDYCTVINFSKGDRFVFSIDVEDDDEIDDISNTICHAAIFETDDEDERSEIIKLAEKIFEEMTAKGETE